MQNNENIYQVFIASSLRLELHRDAAEKAIKEVNDMQEVKELHVHFDEYRYENRPTELQKVEKRDAQEKCDVALRQSTIFFLIIDDVIRSLTQYEFEMALKHLDKGELPQEIHIFYNKNKNVESTAEGISYDDFKKKENLVFYVPNRQNEIVEHSRVYPIPFEAPNNQMADLKKMMKQQLLAFVRSPERPFPGARRGYELTKEHFFTDIRRKKNCPDAYLFRDFDNQLNNAIGEGKRNFVALIGLSLSGKTRAIMEAMKAVDDGWIYIVNMEDAANELERLFNYLKQTGHPKLYIVLDDYDQWVGQKQVKEALNKLFGIILDKDDIIVATASSKNNLPDKDDQKVEWIEIQEMDEREFGEVRDFFVSAGADFDKGNLRYHRTGALFVNLKKIKNDYNTLWLNLEDDTELTKQAKKMLLKAIKALSIWRDDNIGNRILMENLATWFCTREMKSISKRKKIEWDEADIPVVCHEILNGLILDKRMGVSSAGENAPVIVQEYIYRYFIDYDGSLLEEGKEASLEKQKMLIKELLQFCKETLNDEPLTAQVSRLCRRCAYKKESVRWLYNLWIGVDEIAPSDSQISELLKGDRIECEKNPNDLRTKHFYSNVIETYIYCCCNDSNEAQIAYNLCPSEMLTDHLLGALMRKTKDSVEREEIRKLPYYKEHKYDAYVIAVEIEWAENYSQAEDWMKHYILYNTSKPHEMAACVLEKKIILNNETKEIRYDLLQLRNSVTTLAYKVTYAEDFNAYLALVRHLYPYLIDDHKLLKNIKQQPFSPDKLTFIDLVSAISPYALAHMVGKIYGGNLIASEQFVVNLLKDVKNTLNGRFTDEHSLRLTFGYIVSKLIMKLADVPYDEVYNRIFNRLEIEFEGKPLILRNIYTYTAMLNNSSCDMRAANNLLLSKLLPHVKDEYNPLTLNTITLNMIMEKSCGKNKGFNVNLINKMYDELNKQRDSFTYRYLLSAAKSLPEALTMLKEMQDRKIKPNIYILHELMKQPFIKLRTALTMLDLDLMKMDLPEGYKLQPIKPIEGFDPEGMITNMRKDMSDTHIAWGCLFTKKCLDKSGKEVLTACLTFLEEEKPELLEGGYIYNCLLSNESYLMTVNDVKNFIIEKRKKLRPGSFPDSFTAKFIIDRIPQLNGQDRLKAIDRLNEVLDMVMEGKECKLSTDLVNSRLRIYRNQKESHKMDFYDENGEKILKKGKDGKGKPLELSVILYLKTMYEYGYKVDSRAIASYLAIKDGLADNPFDKLVKKRPGMNDVLRTPKEHNKKLLWQFKHKKILSIDDALQDLNWANSYDAICTFGDILNCYIDSNPKTESLFLQVQKYYNNWILERGLPTTSITLSVLAKATTNWEKDMKWLLDVFDKQHEKDPRLALTPNMLSAMSAYANKVEELIKWTDVMIGKGCPTSSKAADTYVLRMASYLLEHDHDAAVPILNNLCQYIVEGGDAEEMLVRHKRNSLMLDLYKEKQNVSASLLRSIIYYNYAELKEEYTVEEIKTCIQRKYKDCIIPLMEMLAADATNPDLLPHLPLRKDINLENAKEISKEIAETYIPQLFHKIYEDKEDSQHLSLSGRLLSYLAYGLSTDNLDNYRQFVKQLYEMDCREIDAVVPGLAVFLKDWLYHQRQDRDYPIAKKTLAQILVYTKLEKLRNGHILLEKAPEQYAVWCYRLMNCKPIFQRFLNNTNFKDNSTISISWSTLIYTHTRWLDDPYPCSLSLCKNHVNKDTPMDDVLKKIIEQQERLYALDIEKGEVGFKDVMKLPQIWYDADNWKPSEELVMAMIRCLSRLAFNPDVKESYKIYKKDAKDRYYILLKAYTTVEDVSENILIFPNVFGPIYYQKGIKAAPIQISQDAMKALKYDIHLDRIAEYCTKGKYITQKDREDLIEAEQWCAKFIERDNFRPSWLLVWMQQLPERWKKIKDWKSRVKDHIWCPNEAIVLAIIKKYLRISRGEGKNATTAQKYISKVNVAMKEARQGKYPQAKITYSMLGNMEDDKFYILIPLKSLSGLIINKKKKNETE